MFPISRRGREPLSPSVNFYRMDITSWMSLTVNLYGLMGNYPSSAVLARALTNIH